MSTDGLRQPLSGGASIGGIDDSVEIYCFINQYVGMQMWWVHGPPSPTSRRRNDAGVGGGTGSRARRYFSLPAVRREQPRYSQSVQRHPELLRKLNNDREEINA